MPDKILNRLYLENRINLSLYINSLLYSKNYNDVEDCLQETFLIVIKKAKFDNIDDHPNINGWLFTIAKNVANRFNAAYMKNQNNLLPNTVLEFIAKDDFSSQLLEDIIYDGIDREKLINDLTNELTPSERVIFELKLKSYKTAEIAEMLNKSESTVKSTFSRLKPKLKRIIDDELEGKS